MDGWQGQLPGSSPFMGSFPDVVIVGKNAFKSQMDAILNTFNLKARKISGAAEKAGGGVTNENLAGA